MTACPECGRDFVNWAGMRGHLRTVHPESFERSRCAWEGCRAWARSESGLCKRHAQAKRKGYRYDTAAADQWLGLNVSERRRLARRRQPRRKPVGIDEETVRRLVQESTSAQGVPERIEDEATIHRVARLLKKGVK